MKLTINGQEVIDGSAIKVQSLNATVNLGWEDGEQSITLFVNGKRAGTQPNGLLNKADAPTATFVLPAGANRLTYIVYGKPNALNKIKGAAASFDVSVGPTTARKAVRGTIIEANAAEAKAREAGFTLWRDWCSVNWSTGIINDPKDIANANAKVAKGWQVILTVTVDEAKNRKGNRCSDFSVVADQIIKGGLDKRIIVQLVNEANLDSYWPNGNVLEATTLFAVPIAKKLKAAGYTVAAPSITYGAVSKIAVWVDQIMANSPKGLWDYLDGHLYADLSMFKTTFAGWAVLAKKYGVKLMSSEWSHKVGNPAFAKELASFVAVMDQYCAIWCWFSFTYGEKFNPMNPYAWRDGQTTEIHDAWLKLNRAA